MQYSGLVVVCEPGHVLGCVRELSKRPGLDVYTADPKPGRIVVVVDTETVKEQDAMLRSIQMMSGVRMAELVYHYFGDEDDFPVPDRGTRHESIVDPS
jgi:nitrate reductase NapAB chaperone NapD